MKTPHPGLLLALGLFLLLRGLLLYTAFDEVALAAYELHPMGTLARNVVGPPSIVPVHFYYDNAAGAQLVSFAAGCLFRVFGTSYLTLKLISFFEMVPALVLVWLLLRRYFGLTSAVLGALLFALPPTTLAKYSLIVVGNHSENIPFMLLALVVFFRAHASVTSERPQGDRRWWFAAGLSAGFALVIFLGVLIPLGLLFLTHLGLRGWRRTLGDLVPGAAGFVIGLGPLILFTLSGGARGAGFLGAKFSGSASGPDLGQVLARVRDFYTLYLPQAGTYPDWLGLPGGLAGKVFLLCSAVAYGWCLWLAVPVALRLVRGVLGGGIAAPDLGRVMLVPLVLYLPLTSVAYGFSDLRMGEHTPPLEAAGYRYFLPHLVFSILMIAIVAGRLWPAGGGRRVVAGLLAVGGLGSGLFTTSLLDLSFSRPNLGAHYEGFDAKQHARPLLHSKNHLSNAEVRRYVEDFTPTLRARVYLGVGYYMVLKPHLAHGTTPDLVAATKPYPPERWPDIARGVGMELRQPKAGAPRYSALAVELLLEWLTAGVRDAEHAIEGYAFRWTALPEYQLARHLDQNRRILEAVPAALRPHFARGFGIDCGRLLRREIASERAPIAARIEALETDIRAPFFHGLGMGLADGREQPGFGVSIEELVPADQVEELLRGFRQRLMEIWGPLSADIEWGGVVRSAPSEWDSQLARIAAEDKLVR